MSISFGNELTPSPTPKPSTASPSPEPTNIPTFDSLVCGFEQYTSLTDFCGDGGSFESGYSSNAWLRISGSTASYNTGPGAAYSGSYYAYTETSSPNYPNIDFDLTSHVFDREIDQISFHYMMFGATANEFYIQVSSDRTSWTTIWSKVGNLGAAWRSVSISIQAVCALRFYYYGGTSYTGDVAIDDLVIAFSPAPTTDPTVSFLPTTPAPSPVPTISPVPKYSARL